MKTCTKCGVVKPLTSYSAHRRYGYQYWCKSCSSKYAKVRYELDPDLSRQRGREAKYKQGRSKPLGTNPHCPCFLGVHVAERVLAGVFEHAERMPYNNPGYDFICGNGYKIDVKSSALSADRPNKWVFRIKQNTEADYFILLAFDNRTDLNPQHVWLIPGNELNRLTGTSISKSTINKWNQWERPIEKIVACCDHMKKGVDRSAAENSGEA
jgi:hypothetical protein